MRPNRIVIETSLGHLDPLFWPPNRLFAVVVLWCLFGSMAVWLSGSAWLLPVWLPVLGIVLWRAAGYGPRVTLAWTLPLGALLAASMVLPSAFARPVQVALIVAGAAMIVLEPVQRAWVHQLARHRPASPVDLPDHATRLQAATSRVGEALRDSSHDHAAWRIRSAVAHASKEIEAIAIPDGDPWLEPLRIARLWLRDLDSITRDPDRGVAAYAAANRRAHQLQTAVEEATSRSNSESVPR